MSLRPRRPPRSLWNVVLAGGTSMAAGAFFGVAALVSASCLLTTDLDGLSGDAGATPTTDAEAGATPSDASDATTSEAATDAGSGYQAVVLADRPAAYFPLDEPATANGARDVVSGKLAFRSSAVVPGGPGISGTGYAFDGTGGLDFGDVLDIVGGQEFTLEAWMLLTARADQQFYELFNKRVNTNDGLVAYARRYPDGATTVQLEQAWKSASRGVDTPAFAGRWTHVVFTYSKTGGTRAWVDGVRSAPGYEGDGGPADNTVPFTLGDGFIGRLDEMAIYLSPLDATRIAAHFEAGSKGIR